MANLLDFLADHPVDGLTQELVISQRLRDFSFKIGAMSGSQFEQYAKECRRVNKDGQVEIDYERYNMLIILNHTLEPNFRDVQALERSGCQTPQQFVNKCLMAGEISALSQAILQLSGFGQSIPELAAQVKNS